MDAHKKLCFIYFICIFNFIACKNVLEEVLAPGEKCTPGKTYKQECNSCLCSPNHSLVCSKMACLSDSVVEELRMTRNRRQTSCVPGEIKRKDCNLCFCNYSGATICLPDDCTADSKTDNRLPKTTIIDLISSFNQKSDDYPVLPSRLSDCTPGKVYKIDCNTCLCLTNGDVMCDKTLCVDYNEINVWAAKGLNEKQCYEILNTDTASICVRCVCAENKLNCTPIPNCIPKTRRSHLYGDIRAQKTECHEGTFYKSDCNKCVCLNNAIRCTLKTCLRKSQVKQFEELLKNIENTHHEDVPTGACQHKEIPDVDSNFMNIQEF